MHCIVQYIMHKSFKQNETFVHLVQYLLMQNYFFPFVQSFITGTHFSLINSEILMCFIHKKRFSTNFYQ
jgi:hypothetical protein